MALNTLEVFISSKIEIALADNNAPIIQNMTYLCFANHFPGCMGFILIIPFFLPAKIPVDGFYGIIMNLLCKFSFK